MNKFCISISLLSDCCTYHNCSEFNKVDYFTPSIVVVASRDLVKTDILEIYDQKLRNVKFYYNIKTFPSTGLISNIKNFLTNLYEGYL
jgi:hypothetical protein